MSAKPPIPGDASPAYLNEILILPDGRVAFKHLPQDLVELAFILNPSDPETARLLATARAEDEHE